MLGLVSVVVVWVVRSDPVIAPATPANPMQYIATRDHCTQIFIMRIHIYGPLYACYVFATVASVKTGVLVANKLHLSS